MFKILLVSIVILTTVAQDSDRISSCQDVANRIDGVYRIYPALTSMPPFFAYCENSVEGGGWTVIHRRFNGDVSFNRLWIDYKYGFGNHQGEYWLGLESMHQITRSADYELLVLGKDINGSERVARFDRFAIESEFNRYRLQIGQYTGGNLGDVFNYHNGSIFLTRDIDYKNTCASTFEAGWWYITCHIVNLNKPIGGDGMFWNQVILSEARMLIRPI